MRPFPVLTKYNDRIYTIGLMDLRDEAKANNNSIEKTIRVLANSISYGIFIEVNRDHAPKSERLLADPRSTGTPHQRDFLYPDMSETG